MQPFDFALLALFTFYWAHAITKTHGPLNVFERIRALGNVFACPVCIAPYIAVLGYVLLVYTDLDIVVIIFAIAGLSVAIEWWGG